MQLKFLDCVTFGKAEHLTAQFTLDCGVCCVLKAEDLTAQFTLDCGVRCVLKAEAQFVYSFNAVNIT